MPYSINIEAGDDENGMCGYLYNTFGVSAVEKKVCLVLH